MMWLIWPATNIWFWMTMGVAQIVLPLLWKQIRWWCLAPIGVVTLYALLLFAVLITYLLSSKENPFL